MRNKKPPTKKDRLKTKSTQIQQDFLKALNEIDPTEFTEQEILNSTEFLLKWKAPITSENIISNCLLARFVEIGTNLRKELDQCQQLYRKYPRCINFLYLITKHTDYFLMKCVPVQQSDFDFLNDVEKGENTFTIGKIVAAYTHAAILLSRGDDEGTARRLRKAILYETEMADEEKQEMVLGAKFVLVKTQVVVKKWIGMVKNMLNTIEGKPVQKFVGKRGKKLNKDGGGGDVVLERCNKVKGWFSEGCKKEATIGEVNHPVVLKICSRCRMSWYCTSACQKQAWDEGHKLFCRKPFQFQRGDVIKAKGGKLFMDPPPKTDIYALTVEDWRALTEEDLKMKGCIFEVVGTLDSDCAELVSDTLRQVKGLLDTDEPFSVKATDMTLIIAVGERVKLS
ncbi:hypothetical protein HDU76_007315 [Blyttiomyces sp. JEL0837]|nr:hypothetical protein HDU76_007315 [Blyttiomyces sp. JEL0837]